MNVYHWINMHAYVYRIWHNLRSSVPFIPKSRDAWSQVKFDSVAFLAIV